jgi:uncharacterized membrane protein (DUF106 family)
MNEVDLGLGAFAGVLLGSIAAAMVALLAMRRWSDQEALGRAKSHAQAHLLEFRLFMDDPLTILRSQRALFADNARIMGLLLKPLLIVSIPMVLLLWQMDALYGRAPLRAGQIAIVSRAAQADAIEAPEGIVVETPPVHIRATGETCWRVRGLRSTAGRLRAGSAETRIVVGNGVAYLPEPLIGRPALSIEYPRATVFGLHWLVWFLILSTVAGFALRRPLRVVF